MTPRGLLLAALVLTVAACRSKPAPTLEPLKLADGRTVPAQTLSRGHAVYTHYCASCHGEQGDGQGPAGRGMRPVPRRELPSARARIATV